MLRGLQSGLSGRESEWLTARLCGRNSTRACAGLSCWARRWTTDGLFCWLAESDERIGRVKCVRRLEEGSSSKSQKIKLS